MIAEGAGRSFFPSRNTPQGTPHMLSADRLKGIPTDQLRVLNKLCVAELNTRQRETQQSLAAAFRVGQRAWFWSKDGARIEIVIERINTKSISGHTSTGRGWRVSPSLLHAC